MCAMHSAHLVRAHRAPRRLRCCLAKILCAVRELVLERVALRSRRVCPCAEVCFLIAVLEASSL